MALRSLSLPIMFAAILLFSQVFARELEEKPAADKKDADLNVDAAKYVPDQTQMDEFNEYKYGGPGYGYGHRPWHGPGGGGYGYGRGGYGHGGGGYGYGHGGYGHGWGGYGHGGGCYYRCGYRCCSAEEYAEFVQAGN